MIKVGIIGKAHGLRGAFFISGRDEPLDSHYTTVLVGKSLNQATEGKFLEIGMQGKRTRVLCDFISSREDHTPLVGQSLWVLRSEVVVGEDEYLWQDLLGLKVIDEDQVTIGTVEDIYNLGASDVVIIAEQSQKLELPLVDSYFHMNLIDGKSSLKLRVRKGQIEDLWQS